MALIHTCDRITDIDRSVAFYEALGFAEVGDHVDGPDRVFATVLAEVTLIAKNPRRARELTADLLCNPPQVVPGSPRET